MFCTTRQVAAVSVIAFFSMVHAQYYPQNARMNALGNTWIMDDMGDVIRYGAYVMDYQDAAQATWNNPIVGIKSIGDRFAVGVIANRGMVLDNASVNSFYQQGVAALNNSFSTIAPINSVQNVPHLLLGLDLGSIAVFGLDLFWEYASSYYHNEITTDPSVTMDGKFKIRNRGFILSARLGEDLIPAAVSLKAGFSRPIVSGTFDDGTNETTVTSDKGSFLTFGGEGGFTVGDFLLTAGTDLNFEKYSFETNDVAAVNEFANNRLALYGGIEGDIFTGARYGVLYTMFLYNYKTTTAATDVTAKNRLVAHSISCGIENSWRNVWIFDECLLRGGLAFTATTPVAYYKDTTSDVRIAQQKIYSPVAPTIGVGLKKYIFQLDATLNPAAWNGAIAGPAVGMVTVTIDFKKSNLSEGGSEPETSDLNDETGSPETADSGTSTEQNTLKVTRRSN